MPEYLKEDRVVCVGEIGLDTGNDHEQYLLRAQLAMAKEPTCRSSSTRPRPASPRPRM